MHATCKFLFDELGDANIPYLPVAHYKSLYIVAENTDLGDYLFVIWSA